MAGKVSEEYHSDDSFQIPVHYGSITARNHCFIRVGQLDFLAFNFRGKGILFSTMLASMMLPAQVLMIPQYLWYQKTGLGRKLFTVDCSVFFAIQDSSYT